VLDENTVNGENRTVDLSDPRLVARYFRYYFFERRGEMDYPVGPYDGAERGDTLLNMLAENGQAVEMCLPRPPIYLRQAFMTAAEAFQAIDANTRGVIVPYSAEGKYVINDLCAAFEPHKQFKLLKRAQQFTVNVFPNVLEKLDKAGALHEVQDGTGVLYLESRWYSGEFGLNVEGTEEMELEYA
jgi:CRISPR-associated endonuclease/helicase Cas3